MFLALWNVHLQCLQHTKLKQQKSISGTPVLIRADIWDRKISMIEALINFDDKFIDPRCPRLVASYNTQGNIDIDQKPLTARH